MIDWMWLLLIPIAFGGGWVCGWVHGTFSLADEMWAELKRLNSLRGHS